MGSGRSVGCIDKRSSAELSEAINSMFRWYAGARVCYEYLSDVHGDARRSNTRYWWTDQRRGGIHKQFYASRWYTRGWTLQELIAPKTVQFYDRNWVDAGEKSQLLKQLPQITGVGVDVLISREALPLTSVAMRMSWASGRETTRIEDRAYCLLGIFDVNMPLLYGEGRKAFQRLQEEIVRTAIVVDHSILAWKPTATEWAEMVQSVAPVSQLLAPSPAGFRYSRDVVSWDLPQMQIFELSPRGLRLTCDIVQDRSKKYLSDDHSPKRYLALYCRYQSKPSTRLALPLLKRDRIPQWDLEGRYVMTDAEDEAQYN